MSRQAHWPPFRHFSSVSVALRVVAAAVLVLVSGAAYYELSASRRAVIADTQRQMARLDMVFAEQTGRAVEVVDLLVQSAAETLQAQRPMPDGLDDALRRRMRGMRQLAAIQAFDAGGNMTLSTDKEPLPIPPAIMQTLLAQYRIDPRIGVVISPPFQNTDNKWNAVLARPIGAPDGTLTGIVAGVVNLTYFEDFYRAVELNENGSIILHLRDGTVLARFPHIDKVIGTSFGDLPPFTEVLSRSQAGTLLMESPVDGSVRVTAIRALRAFPLAVMVSVEQGRILVDWRHGAITMIGIAMVLGGAVIVLLLTLSRRSRQVERLLDQSHAARVTAEGAKDRLLQQISERERAEGALRQAQRIEAIGQLTGGVAHDFNNLLTVVLGNVDILQRGPELRENRVLADRLAAIRSAAERGAMLTGHLLAFARRQPLMPKAIDLNAAIQGMRNLLDSALGIRANTELRLARDLWPAMADQSQIELVILNLVINARDAMPNGGVITIETANHRRAAASFADGAPPGDYVTVTVRDSGVGIPPDILPRVFEPFFTTKARGEGSGLGLSQVFGTAKQSGGEVHIVSEVGRGTAVTVDLPRATVVQGRAPTEKESANLKGSPATILLVDDDDPVRVVTAMMLQGLGYRVLDVAGGEEALALLAQRDEIDILMTDLVMSGINGSQLAGLVRERHPTVSVIFISGYADQLGDTATFGEKLLNKPFRPEDLYQAVETVLGERRGVLSDA